MRGSHVYEVLFISPSYPLWHIKATDESAYEFLLALAGI